MSMTLHLEVPMALVTSNCPDPTMRVESSVKAAKIYHLEVPTASMVLQLEVSTTSAT
jgi:hypothetical protein